MTSTVWLLSTTTPALSKYQHIFYIEIPGVSAGIGIFFLPCRTVRPVYLPFWRRLSALVCAVRPQTISILPFPKGKLIWRFLTSGFLCLPCSKPSLVFPWNIAVLRGIRHFLIINPLASIRYCPPFPRLSFCSLFAFVFHRYSLSFGSSPLCFWSVNPSLLLAKVMAFGNWSIVFGSSWAVAYAGTQHPEVLNSGCFSWHFIVQMKGFPAFSKYRMITLHNTNSKKH